MKTDLVGLTLSTSSMIKPETERAAVIAKSVVRKTFILVDWFIVIEFLPKIKIG